MLTASHSAGRRRGRSAVFRREWRARAARLLRSVADRLQPPSKPDLRNSPDLHRFLRLPGAARLNWEALDRGDVRTRYCATDPTWDDVDGDGELIDLREHVRRLCVAAHEIATHPLSGAWDDVAHNLRLAYSLTDLFAETDIDGASMWCSPVADYESVNTELTEKHLAATIVFTFVWTAFECAVETMTAGGQAGRGAKGRDLVASVASGRMPHLRAALLRALELDRDADFGHRDMRRMLSQGSIPGIAAEYLRQFRNRLIHGDLPKPEPQDWGERSEYVADQDPHLRRFHANTRLLLLLLQTLAIADLDEGQELEAWLEAPADGRLALEQLHCAGEGRKPDEPELELGLSGIASPTFILG